MNWKKISNIVGIIILQIATLGGIGIYAFALGFDGGGNTFGARLTIYLGFCFIIFLAYLQYKIFKKENSNKWKMALPILISLALAIFATWQLTLGIIGEVKQNIHDRQFKQSYEKETEIALADYQQIKGSTKGVKIIGWKDNNSGTNLLETDKNFFIHFADMAYLPETIDYINKNVVGNQVDIILPEFSTVYQEHGSHHWPITYIDQKIICNCDVTVNGKPVSPILTEMLQKIFRERSLNQNSQ